MAFSGPRQLTNGRWVSNGRKAALSCLDAMMGEESNIQILGEALQKEFEKDPVKFFKEMIMPLCPKQMLLPDTNDNDAETKARELRQALAEMELATAPSAIQSTSPKPSAVPPNRMSAPSDRNI